MNAVASLHPESPPLGTAEFLIWDAFLPHQNAVQLYLSGT